MAAPLQRFVVRHTAQILQLEHHLSSVPAWSEAGVWENIATTLAEVMADSDHYSIDSTTVRAHVSAVGGKGGLIDALLAARGTDSPVNFTVWLMRSDDRSPFI